MGSHEIATTVAGAREYLTAHPDEARYRDSAATATVEEGLRVRIEGSDGASMTTDMVAAVGGGGTAPSSSKSRWIASPMTVASSASTPSVPAGPLSMRVAVRIAFASADKDRLRGSSTGGAPILWPSVRVDSAND